MNNDVLPAYQHNSKWPRQIIGKSYNMRLRSSNSIRKNERVEELRTKVSYEYSVSCREFDIENIPLISFLTDPRLKSQWLERLSPASSAIDKAKPEEEEEEGGASETVKIEISSEQNIEKTVSTNEDENVKRTKVSDSTVSSLSLELPAKKLILHRFRSSVREYETPLREQNWDNNNNNNNGQRGLTERTVKSVARQRRDRRCKRDEMISNKENLSNFSFSMEQQLNIKLDTGITVPMATQVHRDFLAAIDFDKFKIF